MWDRLQPVALDVSGLQCKKTAIVLMGSENLRFDCEAFIRAGKT
jgi:hypothetical protein